jgi:hypothetical protein
MPYNGEFATNKANQQLMATSKIKEMLKVVNFTTADNKYIRIDDFIMQEKEKPNVEEMSHVFVIDGSKYETTVRSGSEASLCLFNINQCVINIKELVDYLKEPFPLPKQYHQIKEDVTFDFFLPLKGMQLDNQDEKDYFRYSLYSILGEISNPFLKWLEKNGYNIINKETILETYLYLLSTMDSIKNAPHPCSDCRKSNRAMSIKSFKNENNVFLNDIKCKCVNNAKTLYPTDFLGFHEQLNNENSNEALTTQIMLVIERITLINMVRNIKTNGHIELLNKSTFIIDGTLAVYSHASWLSNAINNELIEIKNNCNLLLIGIEKTGGFVDHFKQINSYFATDELKKGMLYFLEDDYIKKNIKIYDNVGFYGQNNYFGKKMFYKNKLGKLFVVNIAFENESDRVVHLNNRNSIEYINGVIRLKDIVMLLDNFSSQSYENALSLITLANEGAALSSSYAGKRLLNQFIEDILE